MEKIREETRDDKIRKMLSEGKFVEAVVYVTRIIEDRDQAVAYVRAIYNSMRGEKT